MPSAKERDSPSVDRRDRLTLAKLASYDDVATDALVDRVRGPSLSCMFQTRY
jgi:histone-lysine N-methyltransferase SUV420H